MIPRLLPAFCLALLSVSTGWARTVTVASHAELKAALPSLKTGDTLSIAPGNYPGGHEVSGLATLTVEGSDPKNPPVFQGGNQAWHFVRCEGLTVRHLRVQGQKFNGLNLDDGGLRDQPVKGIGISNVEVYDIGPTGNFDAIKCSGLDDLTIRDCVISGWGGQAIDLVGCHRVLISGCRITGKEGYSQTTGPQFKGGCEDVVMEKCHLLNTGARPVNIGGSTGMDYFRPAGAKFEARRIIVRQNVFEDGECAAAFVGVDGAEFSGNTVKNPGKWIFRILQETTAEGFAPCRNVVVARNTFTFRRAQVSTELNIGPGTRPETFRFAKNRWLAEDRPESSKPKLPVPESDGVYGKTNP